MMQRHHVIVFFDERKRTERVILEVGHGNSLKIVRRNAIYMTKTVAKKKRFNIMTVE